MKKFFVGAALLGTTLAAAPASAQSAGEPVTAGHGSFYVSPYAGYMIFGNLFTFEDGTEYSNEDGGLYGAQVGYSFSPNLSLIGNLGYTKSKFVLENENESFATSGDLGIFLYDANLQFRVPFVTDMTRGSWIAPIFQAGVGAIKYTTDTDDLNSDGKTDVAFNVGVGTDFQLMKTVGVRLMLKDYITNLGWTDASEVDFDDNIKGNTAHNIGLTVGLNFGF